MQPLMPLLAPILMGPCSILGYFSSWGPLLVWGPGQVAPPPAPPPGGPGYCPKIAKNLGKSTVFRALRSRWVAKSCKLTIVPAYNPPKTAAKMDVQIVGKRFFKVVVFKISHRFCPWTHLRLSNHETPSPPAVPF